MSFIHPPNKYLWSVCFGASDSVAKTEMISALMELSGPCGLDAEGVTYDCHKRESPGCFVTCLFWKFLKDTFPLIGKSLLDSGDVPDIQRRGNKSEISSYKFSQCRLPGLPGFAVAAFNCGCQLSFLRIKHTWTRCSLYAFPVPTLKLFIMMKLEDHLVQETLLSRVATVWLHVEITHKIYIGS